MFSRLREIYGSGLVSKGIVEISTRDQGGCDDVISQIVEGRNDLCWYLFGRTGNYIMFKIKNHHFSIIGMTIKTSSVSTWYHRPSFSVDVSNDGYTWKTLYSEDYSTKLTNINDEYTWKFKQKSPRSSFVRMYITRNQNNENQHGIYMTSIDFLIYRKTNSIPPKKKLIDTHEIVYR